jgi:hypothetical protein
MITTTLNRIRAHGPCQEGWAKLLKGLGKTAPDDQPLAYASIVEINSFADALWCCSIEPQHDRVWRLFAVWCARQVQHLMTDPRSIAALEVAERYANRAATNAELAAASDAAYAAARAATSDGAYAAAGDAAWAATSDAASDAAWAATSDGAYAAAWAATSDAASAAAWAATSDAASAAARAAASTAAYAATSDAQRVEFLRVVNGGPYD